MPKDRARNEESAQQELQAADAGRVTQIRPGWKVRSQTERNDLARRVEPTYVKLGCPAFG